MIQIQFYFVVVKS